MIVLRPHQERSIASVRAAFRRVKRVLLVAPTGFGKTATASTLIAWAVAKGRRVLFLVHRREIVLDTYRRLVKADVPCGLVMAGHPTSELFQVQVASVQTVAAREHHPPADLIVWDEAHHTAAESYRAIAAQYPDAWHLGLTSPSPRVRPCDRATHRRCACATSLARVASCKPPPPRRSRTDTATERPLAARPPRARAPPDARCDDRRGRDRSRGARCPCARASSTRCCGAHRSDARCASWTTSRLCRDARLRRGRTA